MAGLDNYGYKEPIIHLTTVKQQEKEKQSWIDEEQSERIQQNADVNEEQENEIYTIKEKIKNISGGTLTDLDMGQF